MRSVGEFDNLHVLVCVEHHGEVAHPAEPAGDMCGEETSEQLRTAREDGSHRVSHLEVHAGHAEEHAYALRTEEGGEVRYGCPGWAEVQVSEKRDYMMLAYYSSGRNTKDAVTVRSSANIFNKATGVFNKLAGMLSKSSNMHR